MEAASTIGRPAAQERSVSQSQRASAPSRVPFDFGHIPVPAPRREAPLLERQADEVALASLGSTRDPLARVPWGTIEHAKRRVGAVLGEDLSTARVQPSSLAGEPEGTLARTRDQLVEVLPHALRPDLAIGQALLAHELTHVVQQRRSAPRERLALDGWLDRDDGLAAAPSGMTQRTIGCSGGCGRQEQQQATAQPPPAPLVDQARMAWGAGNREALFQLLRGLPRGGQSPDPAQDAALRQFIEQNLGQVPFDIAYARLLLQFGSEANWPRGAELVIGTSGPRPATPGSGVADVPAMSIRAYYFQGRTQRRALVIGGVHGSEHSGIEVVEQLRTSLSAPGAALPELTTILVPVLFPSNREYDRRYRAAHPSARGTDLASEVGGRYSRVRVPGRHWVFVEPNRNLPMPGEGMSDVVARRPGAELLWPGDRRTPLGDLHALPEGRRPDQTERVISTMLPENIALVTLIERFRPERIVSVHAHRPSSRRGDAPGIFVDPRGGVDRDSAGLATRTRTAEGRADDALTRRMLDRAFALGLSRTRNNPEGDIHYSERPGIRPPGTSLGDWGPTASTGGRAAATTITVEVEGYSPSSEVPAIAQRVRIHEQVIREVFLGQ
jgi:hypothetical protein